MYRFTSEQQDVIHDLDRPGVNIPVDPRNADYQRVLAWVQAGNVIQEPPPPAPDVLRP